MAASSSAIDRCTRATTVGKSDGEELDHSRTQRQRLDHRTRSAADKPIASFIRRQLKCSKLPDQVTGLLTDLMEAERCILNPPGPDGSGQ